MAATETEILIVQPKYMFPRYSFASTTWVNTNLPMGVLHVVDTELLSDKKKLFDYGDMLAEKYCKKAEDSYVYLQECNGITTNILGLFPGKVE